MYLKSLTLRGFKSFASSTTLHFEPGITCIVGPNGAGKSNVVDALAWVLGEQGAKSLRGGRMEDVVFAGTSVRAPLGRAEVELTIDNSDGALAVDYTEVTITRTMFKGGGSEYALNGHGCRLLDIQELLSDSGIGREMHVIVGQGQLDTILHANPEDRRGFIEEAAGVLKHRKRKEKALRKLEATDGNLTRLADLLTELRRQLKPLGRQAEVARRAVQVQADLRDAKARLLADDLDTARTALDKDLADESALRERRAAVEGELGEARARETEVEQALRSDAPRLASAQETWYHLSGLRERLAGTAGLAAERARLTSEPAADGRGPDPDELDAHARRVRDDEARLRAELERLRGRLDTAVDVRERAEQAHHDEQRQLAEQTRAASGRREGRARLLGQVHALRTRAAAAEEEIGRLGAARSDVLARAARAQHDFSSLENQVAGLDVGEGGLDASYEAAATQLDDLTDRLTALREEAQATERERAALQARKDALELGLARKDGSGALLAASEQVSGVLGSVTALVSVRPGHEAAVAAALGSAAEAVVVDGVDSATAALELLRSDDLGRSGLLLGSDGPGDLDCGGAGGTVPTGLPEAAVPVLEVVQAPPALRDALAALLGSTVIVQTLAQARALVAARPQLRAVTMHGDLLGRLHAEGGSASAPSLLEVQAALDEADLRLTDATHAAERLRFDLTRLEEERVEARSRADAALARLHESDATMAAVAEQLGQLGAAARSARDEAERLEQAIAEAEQARDRDLSGLAEVESRAAATDDRTDEEPDSCELERLAQAAGSARSAETDARLALRTAQERAGALSGRAEQLERAAEAECLARTLALASSQRRRRAAETAREVGTALAWVMGRLDQSLSAAARARTAIERARADRERLVGEVRSQVRSLETELAGLVDSVHRDEVARTEQLLRVETLEQRVLDELGLDPESLLRDYGPDLAVPSTLPAETNPLPAAAADPDAGGGDQGSEDGADQGAGVPSAVPYDRDRQSRRLRTAERELALLGRVNPLALEEFAALEERHAFLTAQLEDVKRTRRDLLELIGAVDERVQQVFADAYTDVAREFADVFTRLFPGGEGRLVLTEPGDLLATGVGVEARPAGKQVKRLSLLSGGERSLVAVAFLVALFKARPSPFYILDEVEAALDDTNLGRLLTIYEELRRTSQLLVITHQKRTMEVGDALYGVSMRGDGVSVVISQRLRETESA